MKAKRFAEMRKVSLISLGAIAGAGLTLLATHPSAVSVGSSDLLNEPKPAREIDHGEDDDAKQPVAEQPCAAFEAWFLDPNCRQPHAKKLVRTKGRLAHK
jgi:hypothetical protein